MFHNSRSSHFLLTFICSTTAFPLPTQQLAFKSTSSISIALPFKLHKFWSSSVASRQDFLAHFFYCHFHFSFPPFQCSCTDWWYLVIIFWIPVTDNPECIIPLAAFVFLSYTGAPFFFTKRELLIFILL